ncbi:hypothetical protein AVEN_180619-1, partial [Araneus ventricosus]
VERKGESEKEVAFGGGIRSEKTWRRTGEEGGELVVRRIDEETLNIEKKKREYSSEWSEVCSESEPANVPTGEFHSVMTHQCLPGVQLYTN